MACDNNRYDIMTMAYVTYSADLDYTKLGDKEMVYDREQEKVYIRDGNRLVPLSGNEPFDTISDLQAATQIFNVGDVVEVLGYHTKDDGAGHERVIADVDEGLCVQLVDDKWANLIHGPNIQVKHVGMVGDYNFADREPVTDIAPMLQKLVSHAILNNFSIEFDKKSYYIGSTIYLTENRGREYQYVERVAFIGNGAVLFFGKDLLHGFKKNEYYDDGVTLSLRQSFEFNNIRFDTDFVYDDYIKRAPIQYIEMYGAPDSLYTELYMIGATGCIKIQVGWLSRFDKIKINRCIGGIYIDGATPLTGSPAGHGYADLVSLKDVGFALATIGGDQYDNYTLKLVGVTNAYIQSLGMEGTSSCVIDRCRNVVFETVYLENYKTVKPFVIKGELEPLTMGDITKSVTIKNIRGYNIRVPLLYIIGGVRDVIVDSLVTEWSTLNENTVSIVTYEYYRQNPAPELALPMFLFNDIIKTTRCTKSYNTETSFAKGAGVSADGIQQIHSSLSFYNSSVLTGDTLTTENINDTYSVIKGGILETTPQVFTVVDPMDSELQNVKLDTVENIYSGVTLEFTNYRATVYSVDQENNIVTFTEPIKILIGTEMRFLQAIIQLNVPTSHYVMTFDEPID